MYQYDENMKKVSEEKKENYRENYHKRNNLWLWVLLVVGVLLGIGVVLYMMKNRENKQRFGFRFY